MTRVTTFKVEVTTEDTESDYKHKTLVEEVFSICRQNHWDQAEHEVESSRSDVSHTKITATLITKGGDSDRRHRSAIESVQEIVNSSAFETRQMRFTSVDYGEFDPEDLGEVSELDPEDHKAEPPGEN